MPLRCVEFGGYLGALGAIFIMTIMLSILAWAIAPLGALGAFIITILRTGLGLYSTFMLFNMIGTISGLRGSCPQGYRSGWPVIRGSLYNRDPVSGLRQDEPMAPMFN